MKVITSSQNELIKLIRSLHLKKNRHEQGLFLVEGLRSLEVMRASRHELVYLFCTSGTETAALAFLAQNKSRLVVVSDAIMQAMSTQQSPQDVIGVFRLPQLIDLSTFWSGLVLYEISDPGNMGTIIRTAAALKIPAIVCIGGVDPYSPKVVSASAGYLGRVDIFMSSWETFYAHADDAGIPLAALVVSGGEDMCSLPGGMGTFIVGNEAHGLPEAILQVIEKKLTIPMPGNTESLNAAIATSIALYVNYMKMREIPCL